jgi:hypothetical protein
MEVAACNELPDGSAVGNEQKLESGDWAAAVELIYAPGFPSVGPLSVHQVGRQTTSPMLAERIRDDVADLSCPYHAELARKLKSLRAWVRRASC